ncbi:ATP-binding protein, partial [Streptomyces sp. SID7760]|nr:ATP-binding protein [Streptomyces sp. SID7760]
SKPVREPAPAVVVAVDPTALPTVMPVAASVGARPG